MRFEFWVGFGVESGDFVRRGCGFYELQKCLPSLGTRFCVWPSICAFFQPLSHTELGVFPIIYFDLINAYSK